MKFRFFSFALLLTITVQSCKFSPSKSSNTVQSYGWIEHHIENRKTTDNHLLRVAFIGDLEPKPCAEFPHTNTAVEQINQMKESDAVDFVIGIGDVAHKGTELQYVEATKVLKKLTAPFYTIMGNEEHGSSVERYMEFAKQWNPNLKSPNNILNHEKVAFVLASPDFGRDFNNKGASRIAKQIERLAPKPVILIVHSAQKGVYEESADKGIDNAVFKSKVLSQANLVAVVSGDLHMDMDRTKHSKKIDNIHYLHIPALERTKVPDETVQNPMIRIMTIDKNGKVEVESFKTGNFKSEEKHKYSFDLFV
ncbi:Calcineurin-like phosphoesterase [Paenimyroides ummariense]|uniref:Calcineurin-like phosphoesterase n=1 Tax=Paenimyroides ummariense TaxID=913024 RepID=A0A1I5CQN9_9FLAO|nr:metallophosphoesterase [Paenimyroides ummariense]SFN89310.1 Calcineurin-like phosphoesterase [Paenimyroides ummariense]